LKKLKKIYLILLLVLLLFNWFGYRLLSSILEEKADHQLEMAVTNNDYDESQLVSIKIPVSYLLNYSISKTFERVDGRIQIQGTEYRYVKRRIQNDSLELLCIRNPALMNVKAARNEMFRFVNDLYHAGSDKTGHSRHSPSKSFSPDHYTFTFLYRMDRPGLFKPAYHSKYLLYIASRCNMVAEQPPEIA
jgi:hypothetical protein